MADQAHDWTDEQIGRLRSRFDEVYSQAAEEMRQKLERTLERFERDNAEWKKMLSAGEARQQDYDAWLRAQSVNQTYVHDLAKTLANDAANTDRLAFDLINDRLPEVYAENANWAAYDIERAIGFSTHGFDLYDRDTIRHLMAMGDGDQIMHEVVPKDAIAPMQSLRANLDAAKDVRWNRQKFNAALAQSILQGESVPNAAKRLQRVLNMDKNMATRAARTALTSAENAGRIDSYRRAEGMGIKLEQQWIAAMDLRTRHAHRLLNKQHVPVGKSFVPEGYGKDYSIRFPGDPAALGEMTWNCRCTLVPWKPNIEGEDPEQWSDLPEGMTYEQWKAGYAKGESHRKPQDESNETRVVVDGKDMTQTWKPDRSRYEFDIRDIIHQQGFDGKPQLVDSDEFDRLAMAATSNGLIMQRAYGAPSQKVLDSYREALYNGEFYVDCSGGHRYGRGMYASWADGIEPTRDMQRQSERYAQSHGAEVGYVETMTLDRSAKVISYEELEKQWENEKIPRWIREGDDGVLAAALGYDAIRVDNAGEIVVLNRTKLIIRRPE